MRWWELKDGVCELCVGPNRNYSSNRRLCANSIKNNIHTIERQVKRANAARSLCRLTAAPNAFHVFFFVCFILIISFSDNNKTKALFSIQLIGWGQGYKRDDNQPTIMIILTLIHRNEWISELKNRIQKKQPRHEIDNNNNSVAGDGRK